MRHPDRDRLESNLTSRVRKLNAKQRRELRRLLGKPADPANVPATFWERVREEQQAEIVAALYLIFLANESWHAEQGGADEDILGELQAGFDADATGYAERRGRQAAQSYADTARDRFEAATRKVEQASAEREAARRALDEAERELQAKRDYAARQAAMEEAADNALSDARAESLGVTETTAAQQAGGDAGVDATVGTSDDDYWQEQPHLSKSGVCDNCHKCNGKKRKEWAFIELEPDGGHYGDPSEGAPLGPGCCCITIYANIPA